MFVCLSVLPTAEKASQDDMPRMEEGRRADITSSPVDPISLDLQVRTHGGHYGITGRT